MVLIYIDLFPGSGIEGSIREYLTDTPATQIAVEAWVTAHTRGKLETWFDATVLNNPQTAR